MQFIGNISKEGVEKAMEVNKEIKKAKEELEYLTGDEAQRRIAELREKAIRDEKANLRGVREEEKKNIAKKMLQERIDLNTIKKITGFTEEEIKNI